VDEKRFVLWMAVGVLGFGFSYLIAVTFLTIPESGVEHAKTITGFILGSCVGAILTYFWGSSKGSAEKSETIDKQLVAETKKPK
jgi:hypothetical protein